MKYLFILALIFLLQNCSTAPKLEPVNPPSAETIKEFNLAPLYKKHLSAKGLPVVSTEKVNDYALREAVYLINIMLQGREDIRKALIQNKVRFIVYGTEEYTTDFPEHSHLIKHSNGRDWWDKRARGLGALPSAPATSCGEENLLCYKGDPYKSENILIHEFAHSIHHCGVNFVDKTFNDRLIATYNKAMAKGLWKDKYASRNYSEYFAEGVQSWFNDNRENDNDHNHVNSRKELIEYDPDLAALCKEIFGEREWSYTKPLTRLHEPHLQGYDPTKAPTFVWPERLKDVKVSR